MHLVRIQRNWDPFEVFNRQLGRFLDLSSVERETPNGAKHQTPLVNMIEFDDRYEVSVELPGVRAEEIQLDVTEEALELSGDRRPPEGVADESYRRQERRFGKWQRRILFAKRVDSEHVSAELSHGVLKVTLAKSAAVRPRRVNVSSATVDAPVSNGEKAAT